MELRHLRYFLAAAEHSHFRRAALELGVSQPNLSQQIAELERELGTPLFERRGRRVSPTAAGELLAAHARRVLRELEEARTALGELDGLGRGRLSVGAVQTVSACLLPAALAVFRSAHPGVFVSVEELPANGVETGVADGRLDLGVSFVPPTTAGLEAERLFEEELVLAVPEGHPLARRGDGVGGPLPMRELAGEPLLLMPTAFCTRRLVDECFAAAGVRPRVAAEMNTIEGLLATARRGGGATIVPRLALSMPGASAGVAAVRLSRPTPRRRVGLLRRASGRAVRAADAFAAALRSVLSGRDDTATPAAAPSAVRK